MREVEVMKSIPAEDFTKIVVSIINCVVASAPMVPEVMQKKMLGDAKAKAVEAESP